MGRQGRQARAYICVRRAEGGEGGSRARRGNVSCKLGRDG